MLSRRTTIPQAARKVNSRLSRSWRRFSRAHARPNTTTFQQRQNDGEPLDRDTESVKCDLTSIIELISRGTRSVSTSASPTDTVQYPQFDDPRAYLPQVEAADLWENEANRLIEIVKSSDPIGPFNSNRLLGEGQEEDYSRIARLAEMILAAHSLCLLDNECINVEHCKPLANRDRVKKLLQQAQVSQTNSANEPGGRQKDEQMQEKELNAVFALIDYIAAVLARLLCQMAGKEYWWNNVVAFLAQRVTKLKVLMLDMHANTIISCQAGEAALDRTDLSSRLSSGILDEEECEEVLRMIDADAKQGLRTTANTDVARYCVEQNRFRSGIDLTFRYLLMALRFQNRLGLQGTSFEICGMVYATGFEDFKALLFQDLDLEYSASSDQDTLNTAYPAFEILHQILANIKPGLRKPPGSLQTKVEWRYSGANKEKGYNNNKTANDSLPCDLSQCRQDEAVMGTMDDIVTVIIPLLLTSPLAVANLTKFRTIVSLTCDAKDTVQVFKGVDYSAFFRMHTNTFEEDSKNWDVMRLSAAINKKFFSRYSLVTEASVDREKIAQKMASTCQEMSDWVIDERSITVPCRFHVCLIILVAFLIAGGGLCIMAVGERIAGVDPSNLSAYLWVVAGFYLLVCKSRYVEEWPWTDFLHFRVRCRSVSELHAITGIDEQFIMAKLLHDESGGSMLKTRGPYNKVFLRRDATDGFSIDCLLQMNTLLLSGLIMLKVVTPRGHALVCLDARRGTELKVVEHQGNQAQEHLVCEDINRLHELQKQNGAQENTRLQLVRSKDLKWKRVQGVYSHIHAEFL
ncbi:hypothetical protein BDV30DRAFT_229984 [Aspergillus minisclerotigenes]|uniref:Uncharacterized protein n=1 Tax=Aspergillus minisclerotigenes TaxID=656917 RepID=A0A5N6IS91_9EURO|nr:hypothetical protein BDV30DRAFT_229984 [Aspergillus minisclerotigenes]